MVITSIGFLGLQNLGGGMDFRGMYSQSYIVKKHFLLLYWVLLFAISKREDLSRKFPLTYCPGDRTVVSRNFPDVKYFLF